MKKILIIDDESAILDTLNLILDYEGYSVETSTSAKTGLKLLESETFDLLIVDIQMPEMSGFEVITKVKEYNPSLNIIVITAHSSIDNAIKATRLGAFDFLEKPIDRDKLLISVRNAFNESKLRRENIDIKKRLSDDEKIIGSSTALKKIFELIDKVAGTDVRILITGENGTGKELVARAIHEKSQCAKASFIDVNCAAIPNELIESELFGHEKGSFTGAHQQRIGRFELADGGTLFLDEVGDMSLQAQAKVLRAIEDGKIERVGGGKKISVDVRIIAATNKDLPEEISKGNFREDLLHRLNVIPIHVPPLRERKEDIPLLINHFVKEISQKHKKIAPHFSEDAIELLRSLGWPGNIRELRNVVERIIIIVNKPMIAKKDIEFLLPLEKMSMQDMFSDANSFQDFKEKAERAFILKQLESNNWNISKTAEMLEIQRSHLYNKMKKYGIEKGE